MAQLTVQQAFHIALEQHRRGQLAEAERLYRQILAMEPRHAEALHFLGVIASQMGRSDTAVDLIRRAIALRPGWPEAYINLGNALRDKGQLDESIAACRRAIELKPDSFEACYNLANLLRDKGHLDEAIAAYRRAIALNPSHLLAHNNLGNVLRETRQFDEAIAVFRRAIALHPDSCELWCNLGNALKDGGQLDEAIAAYRRVIAVVANFPHIHNNLGVALREKGQIQEAIAACRQAIILQPDSPVAHNNLGAALHDQGDFDGAVAAYRQAIDLAAEYPQAHFNIAVSLEANAQLDQAIAAYRKAIALRADFAEAHNNLGNALKDTGDLDGAVAAYREAITRNPAYSQAHSNLLMALHYVPGCAPHTIYAEHRQWEQRHALPLARFIQPHANGRDPDRRLRVGYVSADFLRHAVACHLLPLLSCHDRGRFEIFCYANVTRPDEVTERFRAVADHWRDIAGLSDEQAAQLIRDDAIDVLVDLAGHTAGNRLPLFARKPAPVQVTRQGYPDTTGMTAIDYRMTDAWADPPGLTDACTTEQLVRLPDTNWIYQPLDRTPLPADDATLDKAPIVFGSFNHITKVNEPALKLWARILVGAPGSRLVLKDRGFGVPSVKHRVMRLFADAGVTPDRLEFRCDHMPAYEHMALFTQTAIALDPFPYHGTATTCDALWMGVPVVTMEGQTHVSRVGVSLLNNVGLPDLVASGPDDYVGIAVSLAGDRARLKEIRSDLRRRMPASPLMDAPRFARNVEAAYRQMWRTWCARTP